MDLTKLKEFSNAQILALGSMIMIGVAGYLAMATDKRGRLRRQDKRDQMYKSIIEKKKGQRNLAL